MGSLNKPKNPAIYQQSNISSFWKKKGDKSDLDSDRGVFNVNKIRRFMDKMIYETAHMSSSNIGARKNRNIRDHLFVIKVVINYFFNNKNKNKNIDIQIELKTANDLYEAWVKNDKFAANSNKNCQVAVKTPWGSKRKRINIEMQGQPTCRLQTPNLMSSTSCF